MLLLALEPITEDDDTPNVQQYEDEKTKKAADNDMGDDLETGIDIELDSALESSWETIASLPTQGNGSKKISSIAEITNKGEMKQCVSQSRPKKKQRSEKAEPKNPGKHFYDYVTGIKT